MKGSRVLYIFAMVSIMTSSAYSKVEIYTMLELATQSDVILVGKTLSVGETSAQVSLEYVLKGGLGQRNITVSPITYTTCFEPRLHFKKDEDVLIFGKKRGKGSVTVLALGQGKIHLKPETRDDQLQAASWIVALATYDEDEQVEMLVAEVKNENKLIRDEVGRNMSRLEKKVAEKHKDTFIRLINDDDPNVQVVGLWAIHQLKLDGLIPRLSELLLSKHSGVSYAALAELAEYDTPESIAEIGKAVTHKNSHIRFEVARRMLWSKRPEARPILERLLNDDEERIRKFVSIRLAERNGK